MKKIKVRAAKKPQTQNEKILEYIDFYGGITDREAVLALNVGRLASRVHELRQAGYDLPCEKVKNATNSGYHGRYTFTANDDVRWNG